MDCTYLPLYARFPVLTSCFSYHQPRVLRSVHCPLQGEGSGVPAPSLSELSSLAHSDSVTDELGSPQSTAASLHLPDSNLEAKRYYHRLHSKPVLVARTGTDTWELPASPEVYLPRKELKTVGNHPFKGVWRTTSLFGSTTSSSPRGGSRRARTLLPSVLSESPLLPSSSGSASSLAPSPVKTVLPLPRSFS
jgi:hypothetical protein